MPDSTVEDLDQLVVASRNVRRRLEPDAYLNLAFYQGQQWTRWDGNQVFDVKLDSWREMQVDNRIRPFVRTEIAKMTKTRPKWVAVPRSQSDQDIAGARYAEMALDDAWKKQNLARKLRMALLWARICGAGFWKVWWDPEKGAQKDVLVYGNDHPNAGKVVRDGYGAPLPPNMAHTLPAEAAAKQRSVAMGDLCIELRSFFHIFPDPLAGEEGLESAEWVVEEAVYSRGYCEKHFPDHADSLQYDADPQPGAIEARMPLAGVYSGTTDKGKGVCLREYWSADKHVIWTTNKQVLLEEACPYPWLPYVMFRGVPVPGRFWPDAVVTDMRPVQVAINKRESQIEENAERIGNPPLMVPSSIGPDFDWQGLPGEVVEYQDTGSPNAMPQFMAVPELPSYLQSDLERKYGALMEITGQHEISSGQVPAGVTAAAAISLLQEQDDTRLGPDISEMENTIADAGRRMLFLVRNYYTDERHIAVAGESGRWDVQAFKGDLTDGVEDIEVQAGSGMPESKAMKQAAIQQTLTMIMQANPQLLSPRDIRRLTSEYAVGGMEAFFAQVSRDEQQVEDENRRLAMGEPLDINSFDDDDAHIDLHSDFQKTSKYAALAPDVKAQFEQHVAAHRFRVTEKQAAMAPPGLTQPFPAPGGTGPPPVMAAPGPPVNGGPPNPNPSPQS